MRRHSILNRTTLFISCIFLLTSSFNYSVKKNFEGNTRLKVFPVNLMIKTPPVDAFYTLYMPVAEFTKLKHRLVFKYVFLADDSLTLQGWTTKGLSGRSFRQETKYIIQLSVSKNYVLKYKSGLSFGDVVLRGHAIQKIKKIIKENVGKKNFQYVLFEPYNIKTPGDHVGYKITLTADDPSKIKILAAVGTGQNANPSPPKGFTGRE
jgi:hypothetical protein